MQEVRFCEFTSISETQRSMDLPCLTVCWVRVNLHIAASRSAVLLLVWVRRTGNTEWVHLSSPAEVRSKGEYGPAAEREMKAKVG